MRTLHGAVIAAVVGLLCLSLYLATLAPGLTWAYDSADGGELAVAAHTLGIPHPPGYPTYVLLAHPFTRLPIGSLAARTNAFSAVCAAGAAALLAWSVVRLTGGLAASAAAGLALGLSPLLWSQALVTEVHALNALFTVLLLALAIESARGRSRTGRQAGRLALIAGLAWGLSLGNHLTALFLAPLVGLTLWRLRAGALAGAAGLLLGLLVYGLLPVRAAAGPPINWGDPQTLPRLWWVISGGPYRAFALSLPWIHVPQRLLAWSGLLSRQLSFLGVPVAALGVVTRWPGHRGLAVTTGAVVILCTVFAVGYDTTDSYLYLLPAIVCLALWLGKGVHWLVGTLESRSSSAGAAARALVVLLPAVGGFLRVPAMDLSGDQTERVLVSHVVAAPQRAVVVSRDDALTFSLWYVQHGLDRRPDLVVVDSALMRYNWYAEQISQQMGMPLPEEAVAGETETRAAASAALGRPICTISRRPELRIACVGP